MTPALRVDQYLTLTMLLIAGLILPSAVVARERPQLEKIVYEPLPAPPTALIPKLTPGSLSPPLLSAKSALIYDPISGTVLYEKEMMTPLPQASVTKLMTALVAVEQYSVDEVVSITHGEELTPGNSMGLVRGEQITVLELLKGLLIYSGNDAANALAHHDPGGYDAFVAKMNRKAQELHLTQSAFANPTGFDAQRHYASSFDIAVLMKEVLKHSALTEILQLLSTTVTSIDGAVVHELITTNELLGKTPGVMAGKTGSTLYAGECLVTQVSRDDNQLLIVVLGSQNRFAETTQLIEWAYAHTQWTPATQLQ